MKICLHCKKEFNKESRNGRPRKYCSHECYAKDKIGSSGYWAGKKRPSPSEETRKKMGLGISKALTGKKLTDEHKQHLKDSNWQKRHRGELSPFWIKDRTEIKSNKDRHWGSVEYTEWRTAVFKRDGYKCRIGNKDCKSLVQAHHILSWREYPELRYQINNGITLCHAHHPRKRAEEKRLVPIFQELVSVSK